MEQQNWGNGLWRGNLLSMDKLLRMAEAQGAL